MIEKLLAGLVLAVCLVMLGRMLLKPHQQDRFDALLRRWRDRIRGLRPRTWLRRSARQDAARTAEEAIRKARGASRGAPPASRRSRDADAKGDDGSPAEGEWDGNVFRPKSFKPPRKPH